MQRAKQEQRVESSVFISPIPGVKGKSAICLTHWLAYRRLPKIHDSRFAPLGSTFVMRHCVSMLLAIASLS